MNIEEAYRIDIESAKDMIYEQTEEIKRLKEEYIILQNASDEVEEEKDKEIERLNNIINGLDNTIENLDEVIKCKDNIIKEVREYIKTCNPDVDLYSMFLSENYISNYGARDILEILDKESK